MQTLTAPTATRRNTAFATCKFCGERFDLNQEGIEYRNGSAAHEECEDADQFNRANEADRD